MKVAVVTMEVKAGHCEENMAFIREMIVQAKQDQADLIVFPQNCISGYYVGDQFHDEAFCKYVEHFNTELIKESDDLAIVWGNVKYRGGKLFNCAFFAWQGNTYMRVKHKDNHAFARDGYFSELAINSAIPLGDEVLALNFGNEIQLADWNINLDARPFDIHHEQTLHGNVIYCNAVGMQNEGKAVVMMEGGSRIVREGVCVWHKPYGECGYDLVDLDICQTTSLPTRNVLPLLKKAIQGFDKQILGGTTPWVIGLSGGLDSSVSLALLVYALGSHRVIGYGMSTKHNSDATKSNARQSAEALNIAYHEGKITPLVASTRDVLQMYGYENVEGLALENIQARLRGHLLSSFASLQGGVVVNNGNKVENALGYCTLYGDAIGALGVLGDLTKVQLFDLARELNQAFGFEAVPENLLPRFEGGNILFDVAPSAELKSDQVDPMKWFYHDYLVDHLGRDLSIRDILMQYLDGSLLQGELGDIMKFYHLDDPQVFLEDFHWFMKTMKRNAFKYTQVPAILTVSQNGFALRHVSQGVQELEQAKDLLQRIEKLKS